ncbi:MAG: DUF924 family protein [Steroidobacteraceae bacterium]
MQDRIEEVLRFWFEELRPEAWFRKDTRVDDQIRERFLALYEQMRRMRAQEFTSPLASLAAVIVLDQFPRNMFRNSPQAFATDPLALAISQHAIAAGLDRQLSETQRTFVYMPFQHSEDAAMQARSVGLFATLADKGGLDYANRHRVIIDRFGRFPHRNAILGRASSEEEMQFLETHAGF